MSILNTIADIGIGKTLEGIGSLAKDIRQAITGELPAEKQAEIEKQLNDMEAQAREAKTQVTKMQSDIIIAEAKGDSWLQRSWRPMLMLIVMGILANNYVIAPYVKLFFPGHSLILELPGGLWALLNVGVGGYVAGRSGEKMLKIHRENKRR